jgi:hypothetical protein
MNITDVREPKNMKTRHATQKSVRTTEEMLGIKVLT